MRASLLGDLRAEQDHELLDQAFYETPDYRSILDSEGKTLVVGRRGTGKSALAYRLRSHWSRARGVRLIVIAPEEAMVIGLRHSVTFFGDEPRLIRAGCKVAWRYALLMEVADELLRFYKFQSTVEVRVLRELAGGWRKSGGDIVSRLTATLSVKVKKDAAPEERIGLLASALRLSALETAIVDALEVVNLRIRIIVDKLDEGYEPDERGIALLTGLTYAASHINSAHEPVDCILFFRDNVFRAVERSDPDYSRELEGKVLRLHWDEYHLLNMIAMRMRVVFGLAHESSQKVWDACTARSVKGKDGFRKCLRLTLYRPRDLLVLLNESFRRAAQEGRDTLVDSDVDSAARGMSQTRYADLVKEYGDLVPGLEALLAAFANGKPELTHSEACVGLDEVLASRSGPSRVLQHMEILGTAEEALRTLYSIGFLGLRQPGAGSFLFCHDGKRPDVEIATDTQVLVHPCYWIAMNLSEIALDASQAQEIHDEYDIAVTSETPEIRSRRLGQLIAELGKIPLGTEGAGRFEQWVLQAVRILFAGGLVNAELHPNRAATQRRDVVARNECEAPVWKRIYDDYQSRQVIFEVKNYDTDLGATEYRQMNSYLGGDYGDIGFIVTRARSSEVEAGRELDWAREIFYHQRRLIVKLSANDLAKWLGKLRSPQKHDAPGVALGGLLDRYVRMYLSLGHTPRKGKRRRSRGVT